MIPSSKYPPMITPGVFAQQYIQPLVKSVIHLNKNSISSTLSLADIAANNLWKMVLPLKAIYEAELIFIVDYNEHSVYVLKSRYHIPGLISLNKFYDDYKDFVIANGTKD